MYICIYVYIYTCVTECVTTWTKGRATSPHTLAFSKVLTPMPFYRKCARTLTFENFCFCFFKVAGLPLVHGIRVQCRKVAQELRAPADWGHRQKFWKMSLPYCVDAMHGLNAHF